MSTVDITGGNNRIAAFVNRVEVFEFEYDGLKVSGEWYKYKTTTPRYKQERDRKLQDAQDRLAALPDLLKGIDDASARESRRAELVQEIEAELNASALEYFADTIKHWQDEDGNEIPITLEVFQEIPDPFIEALAKHFKKLRDEAVNPTKSANSQSG